jgi:glucosamine 6-phosphate synthetase-like amidotransferase/phosphosugar isomerase protein
MCGIAGFSIAAGDDIDVRPLAEALLHQIVQRGGHATGMAWTDEEQRRISWVPRPVNAFRFTRAALSLMPEQTKLGIFHTRYATQGSPQVNDNNHPIPVGSLVGVHNGHVSNDDELFRRTRVERQAEVDSEAIFALLSAAKNPPAEVLGNVQGRAAVAWLDRKASKSLQLARVKDSPLALAQTPGGSLIFASTKHLLTKALANADVRTVWCDEIDEGVYMKVNAGVIREFLPIGSDKIRKVG